MTIQLHSQCLLGKQGILRNWTQAVTLGTLSHKIIQCHHYVTSSYTYQFFEKCYFVSCLLRFERFVFKNQPARELLIGFTEHELHELHEYVA